jgi:hypothetical protein
MCGIGSEFDLMDMEDNNEYKCSNSKCTNTTPRPDNRLFGVVEYICNKCKCQMEVISTIELCTICYKETPYTIDTHIDKRKHYVEGSGQLCSECWDKINK